MGTIGFSRDDFFLSHVGMLGMVSSACGLGDSDIARLIIMGDLSLSRWWVRGDLLRSGAGWLVGKSRIAYREPRPL